MPKSTIVTEDQLREVGDALKNLDTVDNEIRMAKLIGVDTTEAEKRSAETRQQLSKIRNVYGPGSL